MEQVKSKLHGLLEKVQTTRDLEQAREMTLIYLKESTIREADKRRMIMIVTYQTRTYDRLLLYLYNSMLTFEGLGTVGVKEPKF